MDIRRKVAAIIRERGLSVRKLSRKSGVRRQSIAAFMAGANLHLNNLAKLLAALEYGLEITPSDKMGRPPPPDNLAVDRKRLAALCRRRGVSRLAFFGSVLRSDFRPQSDIDIIVEFQKPPSFFELAGFEEELKAILPPDHPIDLVTPGALSKYFREDVLKACEVFYEKAA